VDSLDLADQIVGCATALEGVSPRVVDEASVWRRELVFASESPDNAVGEVAAVVGRIRAWIDTIETQS
jgi:hypothetical protein